MEEYEFRLTKKQFAELERKFPKNNSSARIGQWSVEIVKFYFRRLDQKCRFDDPKNGADLLISFSDKSSDLTIEIKGTSALNIAWGRLKVSGTPSHDMLVTEKIPLFRVTNVFQRDTNIYVLKHDIDYILVPEPRWRFKQKKHS